MQLIDGHKVICSKECATRKMNKEQEFLNAGTKIETLTMKIRDAEKQLELIEGEKDEQINELLEEIATLKRDNKERDDYIQKLRRTSSDFADEVEGIEQNYISKMNEQEGLILELRSNIGDLIQKNASLQNKLELTTADFSNYENEVEKLTAINDKKLAQQKHKYELKIEHQNNEMTQLNNELRKNTEANKKLETSLREKREDNKKLETEIKELETISRQMVETIRKLEEEIKFSNEKFNELVEELLLLKSSKMILNGNIPITRSTGQNCNNGRESRILLVAGNNGKHLAQIIHRQISGKGLIYSFLKPNATEVELLKTIRQNSANFTKKDAIIFWPNKITSNLKNNVIHFQQHTNIIYITEPYRYDKEYLNQSIYARNLTLIKMLHDSGSSSTNLIKCNNILRKSNYTHNGYSINKIGKWYLSKTIVSKLCELQVINLCASKSSQPQTTKNQSFDKHVLIKDSVDRDLIQSDQHGKKERFLSEHLIDARVNNKYSSATFLGHNPTKH